MKGKGHLILIVFGVAIGAVILYFSRPAMKSARVSLSDISGQEAVTKLERQVQRLEGVLNSFVDLHLSLKKELQQERERLSSLQGVAGPESQLSWELIQPIKLRLKDVDNSLANLLIKPRNEKELYQQLRSIKKELDSIGSEIPKLVKENKSYKSEAENLSDLLERARLDIDRKEQEIAALQRKAMSMGKLSDENKSYKSEAQNLSSLLNKARQDLENKEQEVALLEQRLNQYDAKKKDLEENISALLGQLETVRGMNSFLEKKSADLQNNVDSLQAENNSLSGKKSALENEVISMKNELEQINRERKIIIKEVENANLAKQDVQRIRQEMEGVQGKLVQLNNDYATLKSDYEKDREALRFNEQELGRRADTILNLQAKLSTVQSDLSVLQLKSQEAEKDTAILRQQYVAIQLERQSLKNELDQVKSKLGRVHNQFQEIGKIFSGSEQVQPAPLPQIGAEASEDQSKKVDVKLMPQNEPETKNEEEAK